MVFGYSTNAFKRFTLTEAIEKIARIGFKGVEILGDRPHLYPPDFDRTQLAHLNDVLVKNGMKLTNLNSFTLFVKYHETKKYQSKQKLLWGNRLRLSLPPV